jgi:type IV pilus assembly protein PilV
MKTVGLRRASRRHGYTVVELLMSLTVLALGASGIVAMQRVTIESNRYAKNLAIATRVGEAWADQLVADAARWTPVSPITNTTWLNRAGACTSLSTDPIGWLEPAWDADRVFGPAFDALGNPVDLGTSSPDSVTQFCVHLRYAWLHCEDPSVPGGTKGNGVVRAEIRVFWRRDDDRSSSSASFATTGQSKLCDPEDIAGVSGDIDKGGYNVIYLSTAIREVPQ